MSTGSNAATVTPEQKTNRRSYEAMFLVSQGTATNLQTVIDEIAHVLVERSGGTILAMQKWDERRLAYPINKEKRGVYILVYFEVETSHLRDIEHQFNISESIMRFIVVKADHLTPEEIASYDDRDALMKEAQTRRAQGASDERRRSGVSLGAPRRGDEDDAAPDADDAADTGMDDEAGDIGDDEQE